VINPSSSTFAAFLDFFRDSALSLSYSLILAALSSSSASTGEALEKHKRRWLYDNRKQNKSKEDNDTDILALMQKIPR
jgi:hypothetical protein